MEEMKAGEREKEGERKKEWLGEKERKRGNIETVSSF